LCVACLNQCVLPAVFSSLSLRDALPIFRALPRGYRLVAPSSSTSLSCCTYVELSCHCRCDQRRTALLCQSDVLFSLGDEGVDAGSLLIEVIGDAILLGKRTRFDDQGTESHVVDNRQRGRNRVREKLFSLGCDCIVEIAAVHPLTRDGGGYLLIRSN